MNEQFQKLHNKLESFKSLTNDWDSYGALPPDKLCLVYTQTFLNMVNAYLPCDIFPEPSGSISCWWSRDNIDVDISIESDNKMSYFIRNNRKKYYGDDIPITEETVGFLLNTCLKSKK